VRSICRECLRTGDDQPDRCPTCGSPRTVRHAELARLSIAHLDCDAFYASVEKRDRPELRDRPVIVGGGVRGVVATCCYLARQYGVRSAMPMFKALKACPDAVVVKPDFARYAAESRRVMAHLHALTPLVQTLSLDEAWLDLSGTERLNGGPPALQLVRAQNAIERDTGLTVSVGLAPNKFLAKIASDLDKPRGFSVIGAAEAQSFLAPRPVSILPGVGPQTVKALASAGLVTVGDVARAEPRDLALRFGESGLRLHRLARGEDARAVEPEGERKGMSKETTFDDDLSSPEALEAELWPLCDQLAAKARRDGIAGRVIVLKLKSTDFRLLTRRRSLPAPTRTARTLFREARELLRREADGRAFRLIGVGIADLVGAGADLALFEDAETRALKTETAVDALRARFGGDAVRTARELKG
jgi:DNA polymerase-4